jgi:hypothetical protein
MEPVEHKQLGCGHDAYQGAKKEGQATMSVRLSMKKNKNLHRPHLALTPSDAAFTSTHPERG